MFDLQFIELFDTRLVEVAVRRIRQKDAEEQARLSRDVAGSVVGTIVERALSPA